MEETDLLKAIGHHIRSFRALKKLSQEELAHRSDVSLAYLGKVECGHKRLSVVIIAKIAKGLAVEAGDLFPRLSELSKKTK